MWWVNVLRTNILSPTMTLALILVVICLILIAIYSYGKPSIICIKRTPIPEI